MIYTEQELREHAHHFQPQTTCAICLTVPEDPRDATIRELRAEVERLAGLLDWHAPRAGDPFHHAASARALLARLEARDA